LGDPGVLVFDIRLHGGAWKALGEKSSRDARWSKGERYPMTKLKINLDNPTDDEALALAQMCKRMIWDDFRRLSANESEREAIDGAAIKLRRALADAGFDPR
jgi:hypothetical protein